ncbi:hypothetical protein [Cellulomonas sp. Marseille-Q8402]
MEEATQVSQEVDRRPIRGATGLWTIASSDTVVVVDVDSFRALWCYGGDPEWHHGGQFWITLVAVIGYEHRMNGFVQVGDRHRYTYDFDPESDATDFRWWNQGPVRTISSAEEGAVSALRLCSTSPWM